MSRVLVWKKVFPGSEMDIYNPTSYEGLYHHVLNSWSGSTQNWGNRLWFQGIMSAIDTRENEYGFLGEEIDVEQINACYDFIVLPMANIFYVGFRHLMHDLTDKLEQIKIPVYVVVCGIQVDSYAHIPDLISVMGEDSARFIRAVYNTGGEFALRGYYTKAFFDRLGFPSAVVTGCPSLYQMGPDFSVDNKKTAPERIRPVFNGRIRHFSRELIDSYPECVFMDQDELFFPLFDPKYLDAPTLSFQMNFINNYGTSAAPLLAQGRIVTAADMNDWFNFLKREEFNYSFGSRIHGTIMALLSGVPATIIARDARTQEMAEFFDIPMAFHNERRSYSKEDVLTRYETMDYSIFNRTFHDKFMAYEQFLRNHGIVSHVNTKNRFFAPKDPVVFTGAEEQKTQFSAFTQKLDHNKLLIDVGNVVHRAVRRIIK